MPSFSSIEAGQSDSSEEEPDPRNLEFLPDESEEAEEVTLDNPPVAGLFLKSPAFKSEQAGRAFNKLKETWQAAEANLPEELKNELRHEHKDTSLDQRPVHIGEVVADAPSRQPGLSGVAAQTDQEEPADEPTSEPEKDKNDEYSGHVSITPSNSIYRQAVIYGFGAAIIALIAIALFMVVR